MGKKGCSLEAEDADASCRWNEDEVSSLKDEDARLDSLCLRCCWAIRGPVRIHDLPLVYVYASKEVMVKCNVIQNNNTAALEDCVIADRSCSFLLCEKWAFLVSLRDQGVTNVSLFLSLPPEPKLRDDSEKT